MDAFSQVDPAESTSTPADRPLEATLELTFSAYPFAPLRPREVVKLLRWGAFDHGMRGVVDKQATHALGEMEHRLRLDLEAVLS